MLALNANVQVPCHNKKLRADVLAQLGVLDTLPEAEFDTVAQLAQHQMQCKIALISLVDDDRLWFKAKVGLDAPEIPIEQSFCTVAVEADDVLVVADAQSDPRFVSNPLVLGPPFIRFYAGVPLRVDVGIDGSRRVAIGTLCVVDDQPRAPDGIDIRALRDLAKLVEALIGARISAAVTARLAAERDEDLRRLDREQRQFRQAERMANIGSWRLSLLDDTMEWSSQVYAIHDLPVGKPPELEAAMAFYPEHVRPIVSAAVERTIRTGQPFDVNVDFITAMGAKKRVRSIGELELHQGKPVALIGIFQDVTSHYVMEQALRRSATVDDLTQIANRAGCNLAIEAKIAAARERQEQLALLVIDLDGFKQVNDLCGHAIGDDVLRQVGVRLAAPYLSDCCPGRLGGDEFVLLVTTPRDCAKLDEIVKCLLVDLRQTVCHGGVTLHVSVSIGMSWLDESVRSRGDLLKRADLALYEAKRQKRGTARMFGSAKVIEGGAPRSAPRRAIG